MSSKTCKKNIHTFVLEKQNLPGGSFIHYALFFQAIYLYIFFCLFSRRQIGDISLIIPITQDLIFHANCRQFA